MSERPRLLAAPRSTVKASAAPFVVPLTLLILAPTPTSAGDLFPPNGSFSITYTFTTSTPTRPIDVGGGRDLTVNRYLATMYNNAGTGFLHLVAGRCTNIRFTTRATHVINTKAYCNFRDRDGDMLYAEYTTGTPKLDIAISNIWTLTSGTGKYFGVRGTGVDSNSNNLSTQGSYQAAGKLTGTYKIDNIVEPTEEGD